MAADDDQIFIDVVPKLDERAADEVEGKLKGKLSHVGESIKDSLSTAFDSIGDHLGGAGGPLDKLHDMLSDSFSGREWDNLGKQAGTALGQGVSGALKDLTQGNFGNVIGQFDHFGDVLGGAIDKLGTRLDGLNKAGGALGNVLSGDGSGKDLNDIITGAKGLGLNVPGAVNNAQHAFNMISFLNDHPGQIEDSLSRNVPGIGTLENLLEDGPQKLGGKIHDWFTGAKVPERDPASDKWSSSVAGAISLEANTATISAGSVSLGGNMSFPGLPTGNSLAGSGGGGSSTSAGIGRSSGGGDSGYGSLYSGSSILGKGFAGGGVLPGDSPGHDNMIGSLPGGGMVGLEGGEGVIRPEAMGRPGVADLVASLNQHYDVGTGAGGVGGDSNNPSLSTPPTQGNGGGQGTQQQQLGKGQGGGVSGGGLIGAAEQAGVAAAGVAGFGGGAIAAQMAVQETNLAVQKASQSIAAVATAPFETLGLGGGMMGAPTVNPMGGWIGKLVSSELGAQTQLPNLAHSVQPPKKPDQKPEDQQGQGESVSKGPGSSKDDPMHVNVVNQPQAPQNAATSAMNLAPMTASF